MQPLRLRPVLATGVNEAIETNIYIRFDHWLQLRIPRQVHCPAHVPGTGFEGGYDD